MRLNSGLRSCVVRRPKERACWKAHLGLVAIAHAQSCAQTHKWDKSITATCGCEASCKVARKRGGGGGKGGLYTEHTAKEGPGTQILQHCCMRQASTLFTQACCSIACQDVPGIYIIYAPPPPPSPFPATFSHLRVHSTTQLDKVLGQKRQAGLEQLQKMMHQKARHDIGHPCTESSAQSVFSVWQADSNIWISIH